MKLSFFISLGLCITAAGCQAAPQHPTKVLLAKNTSSTKIAKVKDGTLTTAKASWWGFDKDDSTKALQAAIDSKVPTLIVDNVGSSWLVTKGLRLVSNQRIVFEDGVVVEAKKGSFKGRNETLITGSSAHDVTLEGHGHVVLRMQKADYDNPKLYTKSEHRHGLAFRDSSDLTIRNLTVSKTGGDGLYLGATSNGTNKDILVEDVNFDDNYRQGISVISAQNFTVRHCKLNNTSGTNPKSGIDFEPNHAGQQLTNCVIEDSEFYGNAGSGITFSLNNLTSESKPMSVSINRCKVAGNKIGFNITLGVTSTNLAKGNITLNDCYFDHQYLRFRNMVQGFVKIAINNSTIDYRKTAKFPKIPNGVGPITFAITSHISDMPTIGGVTLNNLTLLTSNDIDPLSAPFNGSANFAKNAIVGSLYINKNGTKALFDLDAAIQQIRAKMQKYTSLTAATVDLDKVHPPAMGVKDRAIARYIHIKASRSNLKSVNN